MNTKELVAALDKAGVSKGVCEVPVRGLGQLAADEGMFLVPHGDRWVVGAWDRSRNDVVAVFGSENEAFQYVDRGWV